MTDDLLRTAIDDAVADVEPADRLVAIRTATRRRQARRRTWWAAGAASLAVASVAALALVVGLDDPPRAVEPAGPVPADPVQTYRVFYVGPGPDGPDAPVEVLYRSTETGPSVLDVLMSAPSDPDYRTRWPEGSLLSYEVVDPDSIYVSAGAEAPLDDALALQQLVFTLQEVERSSAVVVVTQDGAGAEAPSRDVERADDLSVLSHMSIDAPAEGAVVVRGGGILQVSGRGNSFEATGSCHLEDGAGDMVGEPAVAQMAGWTEPRLYPFELELDLSGVPAGTYTLTCLTDDASGGTEGRGTDSDTRTVIVE